MRNSDVQTRKFANTQYKSGDKCYTLYDRVYNYQIYNQMFCLEFNTSRKEEKSTAGVVAA